MTTDQTTDARTMAGTQSPEWVEIGKIVGAQGLKGELRVYPMSDFPERFLEPGQRWLRFPGQTQPQAVQLIRGRFLDGKGLYVVQLAEVSDRGQAESLRDARLLVPVGDRPSLEEDEFHILDLIGLAVYDQDSQAFLGTVIRLIPAGNDLLEVERPDGKTVLIPFVWAIVPVVDLVRRRMEITPPKGLID